jgi:hypothetical protein
MLPHIPLPHPIRLQSHGLQIASLHAILGAMDALVEEQLLLNMWCQQAQIHDLRDSWA